MAVDFFQFELRQAARLPVMAAISKTGRSSSSSSSSSSASQTHSATIHFCNKDWLSWFALLTAYWSLVQHSSVGCTGVNWRNAVEGYAAYERILVHLKTDIDALRISFFYFLTFLSVSQDAMLLAWCRLHPAVESHVCCILNVQLKSDQLKPIALHMTWASSSFFDCIPLQAKMAICIWKMLLQNLNLCM